MDRPDDLLTLGISHAYRAALSKKFSGCSLSEAEQKEQQQQSKAPNLQGEMNSTEDQARLALQATDSQSSAWHRSMDLQAESTRMLMDMQNKLTEQQMEMQANQVQHLDAMLKAERIKASATENDLRVENRRQAEQLKTLREEKELIEMAYQQEISAQVQTSEHLSDAKEKLAFFRLVSAVRARQIAHQNGLIEMGVATITRKRAECDGLYEAIEEFREQNLMLAMT